MDSAEKDSQANITTNYDLLQSALNCKAMERCSAHQVHGRGIRVVQPGEPFDSAQFGDALISTDPSRVISVRTADCVPVLIASNDGSIVAAVHSGWRGVIAEVVPHTIRTMTQIRNDLKTNDLLCAIGPCIGPDQFEVGPEVLAQFETAFGHDAPVRRRADGKGYVDLAAAISLQLVALGVPKDQIDRTDRCTARDESEFFSHRRTGGITGRMASLIAPPARD